ncbi:hypothetical protein [Nonomuraea zeae]|uniref:PPE domain-containing protein n=1 Tax=Nonomuraea zeae TaxID=1642303 RepID=A0A5S4G296_9ACTN|nr:hypothetical protein [Nonomuraea zeae]TMR27079.1 hypothetical protein ETD85_40345 [Nonomuraea zeae]
MADQWKPIRIYDYLGVTAPDCNTTRAQIANWLNSADPDRVERAGQSYMDAAKLVRGDDGVEGAFMKAAEELAEVWRGDGATKALKALRLLHASAGALGAAMHQTGEPMTQYAERIRHYKSTMPAPSIQENLNGGLSNNGGNYGTLGEETTPLITSENTGGGTTGSPELPLLTPDALARKHLENLNNEILELNSQIAEGLTFEVPDINPMTVDTENAPKLNPGSGTETPTGRTEYWTGNGSDGGGTGGGTNGTGGTGSTGGTGGNGQGDQSGSSGDQGSGQDGRDPGQDQGSGQDQTPGGDGSSTDPQDPSTPGQPGTGDPSQNQPGTQDQNGTDQQSVPPVIGANDQTQLADANPANPTTPTTSNPYQSTPNTSLITPTSQMPTTTTTPNPYSAGPGQPGVGTWYGTGGTAPTASPAVLRGGATPGSGFMAYPPGMGMGGGGADQSSERDREIYDPEGDIWSSQHPTSPEKIG